MPSKKETNSKKTNKRARPQKPALGKGLGALLPDIKFADEGFKIDGEEAAKEKLAYIEISKISLNPYQPRKRFDKTALEDLKNSIIENGVLQPIAVRRNANGYELISGERRLKASVLAGLDKIPAIIQTAPSDAKMLELALIENVQREDLNPVETAYGYRRLIEEFNLTQEEVALKIGKDRSTIANSLRLLKLPEKVLDSLRKNEISTGHARALLALNDREAILKLWKRTIDERLSVRAVETAVKEYNAKKIKSPVKTAEEKKDKKSILDAASALALARFEDKLRKAYGTKVKITPKSKESGTIEFEFYSKDDFERLVEIFLETSEKRYD